MKNEIRANFKDGNNILAYLFFCWICAGLVFIDGKHPGCDESYFGRREFSFTLDNDIYLRFQSFNSVSQLENSIKEKCPFKIDIGPVYSVDVSWIVFAVSEHGLVDNLVISSWFSNLYLLV